MASTRKARESVRASAANFESVVAQWFEEDDSCEEGNIFEDSSSEESANEPAHVNIEADDSSSDNITSSESGNEEPAEKGIEDHTYISRNGTTWKLDPPATFRSPVHNIVKKTPGPARGLKTCKPKDEWDYFISKEILEEIINCTNIESRRVAALRGKTWKNVSLAEMEGFLGLLQLSGVEKSWDVPIRELFLDEKANPTYKATVSVNRFEDIRRMIRFDDRRTREALSADDKPAAVRYVWELFLDKCKNRMIPNDSLTVEEQLVPLCGRCSFTQYMPSKPAKYGIKIFWLCDAASAYASDGIVYAGRKPHEPTQKKLGLNVVKDLVKNIEGSSKNITVDNFFTSVQLAEEMLQKQITVVGTIKQNKPEFPNEMKPPASRAIHSSLFAFRGDITMVSHMLVHLPEIGKDMFENIQENNVHKPHYIEKRAFASFTTT
ncbi:piggyBac transposable element-derived protein 4-like [Schistocerca piceifrons]|uniref:piggyBac transposable element-derived protein 4-like n=1 Tax=Schistocerca piceifrons TaxID=274613 RepID=UPI001F5E9852|nr:piggyBac transposable element-derived protein 4-like [Schistocerca piceifrons]